MSLASRWRIGSGWRAALAIGASLAIVGASLIVLPETSAVAAAPTIVVSKSAPGSGLVDSPIRYTLTASNPTATGAVPQYNVSFRDVLPVGVTYVSGSTSPADAGDPTIFTDAVSGAQTLVWDDVADLQVNSTYSLSFSVLPSPTDFPVGTVVSNTASGYVSSDPNVEPDFDATGLPVADPAVTSASSAPVSTLISALDIKKSEPSPEAELMRGVHDNSTTYTLTVTNSPLAATNLVTVADYLPAGLEFLGCGGVDNSAAGTTEYPGSGRLTAVPALAPAVCPTPASVGTVTNPAPDGGQTFPPGVYTKVTWTLPGLAAAASFTIQYKAGVPLQANTATFTPGPAPSAASGLQAANLDNNNGALTAQTPAGAQSLTNYAVVSGNYTGTISGGGSNPLTAVTSHTVTAQDLAVQKSVSPSQFTAGGVVTYSLRIRTSEYANSAGVAILDTLPNGVCPLPAVNGDNFTTAPNSDCVGSTAYAPTVSVSPVPAGGQPSIAYGTVTQNADGTFSVAFSPLAISADSVATVTYKARMRAHFTGGAVAGEPTVSGDAFTNRVSVTGNTSAAGTVPASLQPSQTGVSNTSSATQTTAGATFAKLTQPKSTSSTTTPLYYNCSVDGTPNQSPVTYANSNATIATNPAEWTFRKGDRICFQITAAFPSGTQTRNPVVTDFLPQGTTYEPNSVQIADGSVDPAGANTIPQTEVAFSQSGRALTWTLGAADASGNRFVPDGSVFSVRFSAIIAASATGTRALLTGNLAKMRAENTEGQSKSFRDTQQFDIALAPPITITKGVAQVQRGADIVNGPNGPNVDGVTVREGDLITYRLDVTNAGTASNGNNFAARALQVWDVLPAGTTCANVTMPIPLPAQEPLVAADVTGRSATCYDPGSANQPSYAQSATQSAIVWSLNSRDADALFSTDQVAAGLASADTKEFTYQVAVPDPTSEATSLVNTGNVRSFEGPTNAGTTLTYFPKNNVDTSIPTADQDANPASDPSNVVLASAVVTKTQTTSITEAGNDGPAQAVIGEGVTYAVSVTVPAGTSAFNALLTDPMPTGITLLNGTLTFYPDANSSTTASPPLRVTLSTTATQAQLTFPRIYTNSTSTDQRFTMTLVARVDTLASNAQGVTRSNTATLTATTLPGGGNALPAISSNTTDLNIVEPAPSIKKSPSAPTVIGGQTVTYTLTASNASGRPPLHDAFVYDCVPTGLNSPAYLTPPAGTTTLPIVSGTGTNGCAVGATRLAWYIGTINGGSSVVVKYTAVVESSPIGLVTYTNHATVAGNSLASSNTTDPISNGDPNGRPYKATTSSSIVVGGAAISKTVDAPTYTIGGVPTYTLTATFPANVTFYNASVIDNLPVGTTASSLTTVSITCASTDPANPQCDLPALPLLASAAGSGGSTNVGWFVGNLPASAFTRTVTIVYTARVADVASNVAGSAVVDSANVRWNLLPGLRPVSAGATFDRTGPTATAKVTVIEPQLSVAKTVSNKTPAPGDSFTYSVTVTNSAVATSSPAYAMTITDVIPVGVIVTPGTISAGGVLTGGNATTGGGTITWTITGPVVPGDSVSMTYAATLAASSTLTGAGLVNTASITRYASLPTGTTGARIYTSNPPTATATVTPGFPRITASKAVATGPAYLNHPVAYTIRLTNSGSTTAYGVNATDVLPRFWTFDAGSAFVSVNGGSPTAAPPTVGTANPVILSWSALGTLGPGQSLLLTYTATPTDALTTQSPPLVGSTVPQTNTVVGNAFDATGASGNATGSYSAGPATATTHVDQADLQITKSGPATFVAGRDGSWTVLVTNNGPDAAAAAPGGAIQVVDTFPAGLDPATATVSGPGWTCSRPAANWTCIRSNPTDTLAVSASFPVITITVPIPAATPDGATYTNTASVTPDIRTYDPNATNDTSQWTSTVNAQADLEIVKALSGSLVAGRPATYTLDVTNHRTVGRAGSARRD